MKKRRAKRPKIPSKELRAIWDQIPKMVDCKGECAFSCGPVPCSKVESDLIKDRSGEPIGVKPGTLTCNMLTVAGACSVYSVRPMMCRVWGTTRKLACPRGCKPERWLTDQEVADIFKQIEALDDDEDSGRAVERMIAGMTPRQRAKWRASKEAWDRKHGPVSVD